MFINYHGRAVRRWEDIKRQFFVNSLHWPRCCKTVHFVSNVQKWKVLLQRIQNYLFSHLNVQICDARIPTSGEMLITKVIKYFPEVKLTTVVKKKNQSTRFFIAILRNFHARLLGTRFMSMRGQIHVASRPCRENHRFTTKILLSRIILAGYTEILRSIDLNNLIQPKIT